jgi:transcriptional regulator with XRE-family HTH domain
MMSKPFNLPALRGKLGLDQAQMAERMGLEKEAYLALEADAGKVQRRHATLAHMASLDVAIERGDPKLASTTIREKIMAWHQLRAAQTPSS